MRRADVIALWAVVIAVGMLGGARAFCAPNEPSDRWRPNPTGAALRSLALPGWGQVYNRQPLKAVIYGGLEEGLIYGIYRQHQLFRACRGSGDGEGADFYQNDRNRLTWYLAGTVILSMVDAYVDAHLYDFDVSEKWGVQDNRSERLPLDQPLRRYERGGLKPGNGFSRFPILPGVNLSIGYIWR